MIDKLTLFLKTFTGKLLIERHQKLKRGVVQFGDSELDSGRSELFEGVDDVDAAEVLR